MVVGASRGIGKACALELAASGHDIVIFYRQDDEGAARTVEAIQELGRKALAVRVDVSVEADVRAAFRAVLKDFGRIRSVVYSSGITADGLLATMSLNNWDRVISTNLTGAFLVCRESVKALRKTGGSIVLISSTSGISGQPGQANYSATKGGINALTQSMAKEMASFGIRVNAVAPGFTNTDMLKQMDAKARREYTQHIPLQRIGEPHEIAAAVAFLIGHQSSYITGQVLAVDGGLTS
ncbi:putative 3-oxoacyl-(acyl carrier protein) reductase [Paenarthrobacter aurescens TC1]|uniref:3-oxoacyl-(Acyl carrier protein) reductase n=1 Tax=Paenarthrobacter aurescens (strain TC1) TaxID=290340 RepID=A1R756_PAEAT|nr:putative 3-oxoacyl-(acyl carrier protein) reductase [Paenarthrobacter aurescens TC1]